MSYSSFENTRSEADFQKLAQTIATSIQKILQNVSSMQRMVNQFGTAQDSPELKQQLYQIRTYTQQLIKDTDALLKDLVNCKDRHLKIQRDRLVDEFTSALTAFQAVQRKTVDLEKNAVRQARAHTNQGQIQKPPGASTGGTGSGSAKSSYNTTSLFEDNFVNDKSNGDNQMQLQEQIDLQALEDQEQSIRELEDNITSVNEIYKKLGAMVYEQGHIVDSIEASVEQTSVFVSEGTESLRKASHFQTKARKKKLIMAAILAAILLFIGFIIYLQS